MEFGLIISNTNRSKTYIKLLVKNSLYPKEIFFYSKKRNKFFLKFFLKKKLKYCYFKTENINNPHFIKIILKSKLKNLIYSGYSGQIINSDLLKKKNLIHCHPGKLPNYRGSTTIFYSLINERAIACSVFRMTKKIDMGKIYYIKNFIPPKNLNKINNEFDDYIRAATIISFLKKNKKIIKNKKYFNVYYIAHTVIRRIALNYKSLFFLKKLNYSQKN
jgi:folate-dependent phosphoribosylglycinamide formyltransferase PurN